MGKRSDFKRHKHDRYATPEAAVLALLPHLAEGTKFYEPCAGRGHLIRHLKKYGHRCVGRSDRVKDFRTHQYRARNAEYFITNPPWTRELLHPGIENLAKQKPTWLLLDADWMHTKQAKPLLRLCRTIVSVGRVKWLPNSPHVGKDNACWYLFAARKPNPSSRRAITQRPPLFYGR